MYAAGASSAAYAQPPSFDAYRERFLREGTDPFAVARIFVEGLLLLTTSGLEALGEQVCALVHATTGLRADSQKPSGFSFPVTHVLRVSGVQSKPNVARALAGGTPAASYADYDVRRIQFYTGNPHAGVDYPSAGQAKLFVVCTGATSHRPITLARNASGTWKVTNCSGLLSDVQKPPAQALDF